jgi:proteasome lid subunit RPN8/RPN11
MKNFTDEWYKEVLQWVHEHPSGACTTSSDERRGTSEHTPSGASSDELWGLVSCYA